MRPLRSLTLLLSLVTVVFAAACARKEAPAPAAADAAGSAGPASADGGKIPITTTSPQAKAEFVQGQDLVDKLKITDSLAHFQKAIELDPSFAWAELALAQNSPTGTAFFEHLAKAVALAEKASDGERYLIAADTLGGRRAVCHAINSDHIWCFDRGERKCAAKCKQVANEHSHALC